MSRGRSAKEWEAVEYISKNGVNKYCNGNIDTNSCADCPFCRSIAPDCSIEFSGFRSNGKHLSEKKKELELFIERVPKNIQNVLSLDIYIVAEAIRLLQEREDNLNIKKNIQLIKKL